MTAIQSKTIITESKLPEVDFCFNPYIGCTHGCAYCYARFMGRFTGHANEKWGTYLDWKVNAPELLVKELPKVKKKGGTVILGSVTDCYQPVEKKLEITRECLKKFLDYQIDISILTKNKLAERDFDLLEQFDNCEFGVSLSILDLNAQKILEPGASTPQERLLLLNEAKKRGLKTYLFLGPIHPFLSDVQTILEKVSPYIDFVMAEAPNLKCGNWYSLSEALKALSVNCLEYKRLSNSQEFYDQNKNIIKKMCNDKGIEFRGIFNH